MLSSGGYYWLFLLDAGLFTLYFSRAWSFEK